MKKGAVLIAGLLCIGIVLLYTPVFAGVMQTIDVAFGQVKLVVNGTPVASETLLYKGTTYVPLKAVTEMLGETVAYNNATQTAYIGTEMPVASITQPDVATVDSTTIEIVDSGYIVEPGINTSYVSYAAIIKNLSAKKAVRFPTIRVTARDASGAILGTEDFVGREILPNESWYVAKLGPSVETEPATVDFEVVQPDENDWVSPSSLEYAGTPLIVENPARRGDKIVGEVINPNDYDIDSASVVVLFRNNEGNLYAGKGTYIDKVTANGRLPFEISISRSETYVTDNFDVYAYPW